VSVDAHYLSSRVDRVSNPPEVRTVFDLVAVLSGAVGVVLTGIGLREVWGGIWSAFGFVLCVAVVAVSGFDLASSTPRRGPGA